jgi:DNA-binding transcriptional LysR family regulator
LTDREQLQITLDCRAYARFDSGEAIRTAAIAGMGIGYLPSFMIEKDLLEGRLVKVLADTRGEEIAIHAIYPNRRHLSVRVLAFIDNLKKFLNHT